MQILKFEYYGESSHGSSIFDPQTGTLFSGDLIYSQVHLWLVEHQPAGWLSNIQVYLEHILFIRKECTNILK